PSAGAVKEQNRAAQAYAAVGDELGTVRRRGIGELRPTAWCAAGGPGFAGEGAAARGRGVVECRAAGACADAANEAAVVDEGAAAGIRAVAENRVAAARVGERGAVIGKGATACRRGPHECREAVTRAGAAHVGESGTASRCVEPEQRATE